MFQTEVKSKVNPRKQAFAKRAQRFNVSVLALASLNRALAIRAEKCPQLSDLRGSGSIVKNRRREQRLGSSPVAREEPL
jgi:replicative DNA helicase